MFSSKDLFFTPASGAYTVSKSLRFRGSATAYLNRSPASASNQTTWTLNFWVKLGDVSTSQITFLSAGNNADANRLTFYKSGGNIGLDFAGSQIILTSAVYRDPSAWYMITLALDTTQTTSSNRVRLYVNGVQVTNFSATTYPAQNATSDVNSTKVHYIGRDTFNNSRYFDGYFAETNFLNGYPTVGGTTYNATTWAALNVATLFGAYDTNGIWQPAAYTGNYGTNGYYLKYTDVGATSGSNTGYGKDFAGTNYWTTNNFGTTSTATTYDSMLDSPTNYADTGNGVGNYPVLNPLSFNSSNVVDGNLAYLGANLTSTRATFAMPTSGKWYWELTPVNASPNYVGFGLMGTGTTGATNFGGVAAGSWGIYPTTNMFLSINGSSVATGIATPALGMVFAAAYDADTGNFWIGYSSSGSGSPTWFNSTGGTTGNPATGANPMATISAQTLFPAVSGNNTTADKSAINFGQRPFALTVPSGYSSLNTQNLTTPTITNGAQYMAAVTYPGATAPNTVTATSTNSGNNPNAVTFQPDLVWIKARTATTSHKLTDSTRGVTKAISTDSTAAESTDTNGLTAFTASGFTVGSDTNYNNTTGPVTYVAWEWKEGVSQGFDIVSYAGDNTSNRNISHNLGVAPAFVWVKSLSTGSFYIYHQNLTGSTYFLKCNSTDGTNAQTNTNTPWGTGNWSSTQFMVTNNATNNLNASSTNYIGYLWAAIAGYSAFGSYTGNGLADGPFVYTNMRSRFILIKRTDSTGNWLIWDTTRSPYNLTDLPLYPNLTNTEAAESTRCLDVLSNGFKLKGTGTDVNASGSTYVYACFSENPFKISRAR